eukprot:345010-Chlamydomonas_euryale.AAC.2
MALHASGMLAGGPGPAAAAAAAAAAVLPPGTRCASCQRTLSVTEQRVAPISGGRCLGCIVHYMPGGTCCRVCRATWGRNDPLPVQCVSCALLMHPTCAQSAAVRAPGGAGDAWLCPGCQSHRSQQQQHSRDMLAQYEARLRETRPRAAAPRDMYAIFQADMMKWVRCGAHVRVHRRVDRWICVHGSAEQMTGKGGGSGVVPLAACIHVLW